jgi:hypothetical protein
VKSYLGFCGFYRQFIRNFGKIAKPLSTITRPTEPFVWTSECKEAFEELRRQLLDIQATYHFNPELPTKLETNTSDGVTTGGLSQQYTNQQWYPIGFYSHVLAGAEINWEIHNKELSAIVQAFEKWRPELMSCRSRVGVYSDHRSLEYFMTTAPGASRGTSSSSLSNLASIPGKRLPILVIVGVGRERHCCL